MKSRLTGPTDPFFLKMRIIISISFHLADRLLKRQRNEPRTLLVSPKRTENSSVTHNYKSHFTLEYRFHKEMWALWLKNRERTNKIPKCGDFLIKRMKSHFIQYAQVTLNRLSILLGLLPVNLQFQQVCKKSVPLVTAVQGSKIIWVNKCLFSSYSFYISKGKFAIYSYCGTRQAKYILQP